MTRSKKTGRNASGWCLEYNAFLGYWFYLVIFWEVKVRCLTRRHIFGLFVWGNFDKESSVEYCFTVWIFEIISEMISATEKIINSLRVMRNIMFFPLLQVLTSILWTGVLSYPLTVVTGGGRRIRIGRWRWRFQWSWRGQKPIKFGMMLKLSSSMAWRLPKLQGIITVWFVTGFCSAFASGFVMGYHGVILFMYSHDAKDHLNAVNAVKLQINLPLLA